MAYLIDANVFIDAKNRYYGFDFCSAFWDWAIAANRRGLLLSIAEVGRELRAGNDSLAAWAAARDAGFFAESLTERSASAVKVGNRANAMNYNVVAIEEFMKSADFHLIAYADKYKHTIVTLEAASPEGARAKRRVLIPDMRAALGIACVTPFEMLRRENARFVLGAAP